MPESRKRKPKHGNTRRRLGALDGTRVKVTACCRMVVEIGVGTVNVHHDDRCAAIDYSHPDFITARTAANRAVVTVLNQHHLGPAVAVLAAIDTEN